MKFCLYLARSTRLGCRPHGPSYHGASWQCPLYHPIILSSSNPPGALKLRRQIFRRNSSPLARYRSMSTQGVQSLLSNRKPIRLSPTERNDPDQWIQYLEPFLQACPHDKTIAGGAAKIYMKRSRRVSETDGVALATLLREARRLANLDLLAHLGYQLGRWFDAESLLNMLLDAADANRPVLGSKSELPSNLAWGSEPFLTYNYPSTQNTSLPNPTVHSGRCLEIGLEEATSDERAQNSTNYRIIMGEVWQSLGSFILGATKLSKTERKAPMSIALEALARLHHSGFIPDAVYKSSNSPDTEANFRPPGMYILSTYIVNALSDVAWTNYQQSVSENAAKAGEQSPFLSYELPIRELGLAVWLEFVLWCCVEGAYIREGVWILERMKAGADQTTWDIKSWKVLLDNPNFLRNTNIHTDDFWRSSKDATRIGSQSKKSEAFYGLGKWTISVEIVNSLNDGILNAVTQGVADQSYPLSLALQHLDFLDSLIRRNFDRNQELTSEIPYRRITRLLEAGAVNNETDPVSLERLLDAFSQTIPPWDDSTPTSNDDLNQMSKHDLYGTSLSLIGLMDYNLRWLCLHRQTGRAVTSLSRLLRLIDESKLQHMDNFLRRFLSPTDGSPTDGALPSSTPSSRKFSLSNPSIPQLSKVTLGGLVDLLIRSRGFRLIEWLLFSMDADGPLIPPSLYGDQAISPSIIRFAAASRNQELFDKIIQSLPPSIGRNTLKTLLNYRMTMGQWEMVEATLNHLRDYKHKSWGASNVTALAAAVMRVDRSTPKATHQSVYLSKKASLAKAKDLLRRLLNGEFDSQPLVPVRSAYQERMLYRLYLIFSSIPGVLREVCQTAHLKYNHSNSHDVLPEVPVISFHDILSVVVDLHGSSAGKQLWEQWCIDLKHPIIQETNGGDVSSPSTDATLEEKEWLHSRVEPGYSSLSPSELTRQLQKKAVVPNLNTVRIIALAAVKENRQQMSVKTASKSSPTLPGTAEKMDEPNTAACTESVLDFCIERFRRLRLDDKEIDREVQGYLSRQKKKKEQRLTFPPCQDQFN